MVGWPAGQSEGTLPGRAHKLFEKDNSRNPGFTNSAANVSTGNNNYFLLLNLTYFCLMLLRPPHALLLSTLRNVPGKKGQGKTACT